MVLSRKCVNEKDYERLSSFIIKLHSNDKANRHWGISRLDWYCYHGITRKNSSHLDWTDICHIWENENNEIVSAVIFEGLSFYSLQIHDDYLSPELVKEMMVWAENFRRSTLDKSKEKNEIFIEVQEDDEILNKLAIENGYKITDDYMLIFKDLELNTIPEKPLPEGYYFKNVTTDEDYMKKRVCHNNGFGIPEDVYPEDSFKYLTKAPSYNEYLDVVVETDEIFVASCVGWYDNINKIGYIEPLVVHKEYHGKGIGKAIIYEVFKRLRKLGAKTVDMATNEDNRKFYESVGYEVKCKSYEYIKEL